MLVIVSGAMFVYFKTPKPESSGTQDVVPGVTATEIIIGSSSALSGQVGYLGSDYIEGAMTRINQINEEGGIYGRKIRVIAYDDQYDPPKTVANTQKLIEEDKVFALFNYTGTPTAVKIIPMVEEKKIPLVGLLTGANVLREPFRKYIFNIRASYYQETELAVSYFTENLGLKKIGVFYQSDAYGLDGLEGAKIALQKKGKELVTAAPYVRGTMNVEEAAEAVVNSGAEAVIMVGTASPSAKFVKLVKLKKPEMLFHSVSFVGPEEFIKNLEGSTENVFVTQVIPPVNEYEAKLFEGVALYRNALKKYYPGENPSFGGGEGFINARILIEALRRSGKDLTREKFMESLESIKDYSVGIGAAVTFGPDKHQGMDSVYLTIIKDGKFTLVLD